MKIEITQPQAKRPKGTKMICKDCGKALRRKGEYVETCSIDLPYLLLCESCYRKRGNSVR